MASALLSPQSTLLLATPLISSSFSLWFSHDQHVFFSALIRPNVVHANAVLPVYFANTFRTGAPKVAGILAITAVSAIAATRRFELLLRARGSLPWYVAAASLAAGHLLFVPVIAPTIRNILNDAGGDAARLGDLEAQTKSISNTDYMKDWLRINLVRTLTVDLGAWICAVVAVVKTFSDLRQ